MERMPKPGDRYQKSGKERYQVAAVAEHTETGEKLVVFQELFGDFQVYAQPLERFAEQMQPEDPAADARPDSGAGPDEPGDDRPSGLNPLLLDFLEEEDYGQKLAFFASMRRTLRQEDLDVLFETLELQPPPGADLSAQADAIEAYLKMQWKFNGTRLR